MAAVGVVFLLAVGNTANLLLARIMGRAHELGIRTALGAERGRIIRQLLTESLLLSCGAGVLGIAFSYALVRVLVALDPGGIPRFEQASVDFRVLAFAIALSMAAGALAGTAPALLAGRANVNEILRSGGRVILQRVCERAERTDRCPGRAVGCSTGSIRSADSQLFKAYGVLIPVFHLRH